eukprot:365942-Chlamydomonas_euryale.AAC.57
MASKCKHGAKDCHVVVFFVVLFACMHGAKDCHVAPLQPAQRGGTDGACTGPYPCGRVSGMAWREPVGMKQACSRYGGEFITPSLYEAEQLSLERCVYECDVTLTIR